MAVKELPAKKQPRLAGTQGVAIAVCIVLAGVVGLYLAFLRGDDASNLLKQANHRTLVDAENGKTFTVDLTEGKPMAITSPFTGRDTGREPELCYWTADGQPKATPDYVLLNGLRIPRVSGPTFCPVCHRLVVSGNPPADAGVTPPPTEAEYKASPASYRSLFRAR